MELAYRESSLLIVLLLSTQWPVELTPMTLNVLLLTFSAFCPYHIGHFSVVGLGFEEYVRHSPVVYPLDRDMVPSQSSNHLLLLCCDFALFTRSKPPTLRA